MRYNRMMNPWLPSAITPPETNPNHHEQDNFWSREHLVDVSKQIWERSKRPAGFAIRTTLAIGAGMAAGIAFGDTTVETEHLEVEIHTEPTLNFSGGARINTPVLDLDYPTHSGPYGLEITPEDISFNQLIDNLAGNQGRQAPAKLSQTIKQESLEVTEAAQEHIIKFLLISGLVSSASYLAISRNGPLMSRGKLAGAALAGGLVIGIPAGVGYASWDADAFSKRAYSGDLTTVIENPDMIKDIDRHDATLSGQARYIVRLLDAVETINNRTEEEIAVRALAVSDIHQRNVFPIMKSLVENYGIDFVTDNGDIVDWGQSFENDFFYGTPSSFYRETLVGVEDLDVPYYFTGGNHDNSLTTLKALGKAANVVMVDSGQYYDQNGLVIVGAKDPVFTPDLDIKQDQNDEAEIKSGQKLQTQLDEQPADIALLHNPLAGEQVTSGTQIQVSGHKHKFKYTDPIPGEAPARLNTGTSGGAGLRTFDNEDGLETEQTFTLMNFGPDCQLVSLDKITITSLSGDSEFNVKHIPVKGSVDPGLFTGRKCE